MFFLALMVVGGYSWHRLEVDVFPEIDFPSISIVTTYPGVSPEEMETLVTRPMESAIARVENLVKIESFSAEGRSRVALRFDWGADLEAATNDVRGAIERIRDRLPEGVDTPLIFKFNISALPVMSIALDAAMTEGELRNFAENVVKPYLERADGVASADVQGVRRREIHAELNRERLTALELGPLDVVRSLREATVSVPAGLVGQGKQNVLVRTMSEFSSLEEIRNTRITTPRGAVVPAREVVRVVDAFEEYYNVDRINGVRGATFRVLKNPNKNTVKVAAELRQAIAKFNADFDGSARLTPIFDSSVFVRRSIEGTRDSVLVGAGLAVIVLLLFLRSITSTLVISIAIPISIIATFFLMDLLDLTLNLITFGGLALGIGMLVDNAVVILENIFRRREGGDTATDAALVGTREVSGAVVASTVTTLVVFLPVVFLGGFPAVFFGQMALVVTSALLCSLLVALTLVPMLSAIFLRRGTPPADDAGVLGKLLSAIDRSYGWVVGWALRGWWLVIALSVASLWLTLDLRHGIGMELLPESDESEVRVNIEYPVGTRIETTEEGVIAAEKIVAASVPEATVVQSGMGSAGFFSTSGEESGSVRINLVPPDQRTRSSAQIAKDLVQPIKDAVPGARISARAGGGLWLFQFLRGGEDRLSVEIRGFDLQDADQLANRVSELALSIAGVADARPSRTAGASELRLTVDRARAEEVGVSVNTAAQAISALTQGAIAGVFREGGDEFEIRVRLPEAELEALDPLLDSPLLTTAGQVLRVRDLARQSGAKTPKAIDRLNQERVVYVQGGIDNTRDLGSIVTELTEKLRTIDIPPGFTVRAAGEASEQAQSFEALGGGLLLALFLVYIVMAAQFESLIQPLIVMVSVPFAAIGVLITLSTTKTTLNLNSALGVIVLVGVVVNNAIVLVDYANLLVREQHMPLRQAVIETARRRLRPILMTTSTTVLALLPVAMSTESGAEAQTPLARVVVGGMTSSTLITLVLVPVLYFLVEATRQRFAKRQPS
jgi:HAE1 family hydrophobic/amphiphilic exporter-1